MASTPDSLNFRTNNQAFCVLVLDFKNIFKENML